MLNLYWNSRVLEALALDELALGYRWLLSNGMASDMVGERYAFIITGPGIAAKLGLEVDFAIALSEPEQDEDGVYHAMRMPAATAPLLAGMVGLRWQIAEVLENGAYRPRLSGELKLGSITGYNPPPETPVFSDSGILIIEDDESDEAVSTRRLRAIGVGRRGVASYVARFLAGRIAEPTEAAEFALLQKPAVDAAQEGRELIDGAINGLGLATTLKFAEVDDKVDSAAASLQQIGAQVEAIGEATEAERVATAGVRAQAQAVVDAGGEIVALAPVVASDANRAEQAASEAEASRDVLYKVGAGILGRPVNPVDADAVNAGTILLGPLPTDATGLSSLKVFVKAAGTITVGRYSLSGGTVTRVATHTINTTATGLQSFPVSIPALPGDYISVQGTGLFTISAATTADGPGWYNIGVNTPASAPLPAASTTTRPEVQINYVTRTLVVSAEAFEPVKAKADAVPALQSSAALLVKNGIDTIGRPAGVVPITGTNINTSLVVFLDPVARAGTLTSVDLFDNAAGTAAVATYRLVGGVWTRQGLTEITTIGAAAARTVTLALPLPVQPGDLIAIRARTTGAYTFNGGGTAPDGAGYWLGAFADPPATITPGATSTLRMQVRFNIVYAVQTVTAATVEAQGAAIAELQGKVGVSGGSAKVLLPDTYKTALYSGASWFGLVTYGQSNSNGWESQPALSTTQVYPHKTFGSGVRSGKPGNAYGAVNTSPGTTTSKALFEENASVGSPATDGSTDAGESVCTAAAGALAEYAAIENAAEPYALTIFASAAGKGGRTIAQLAYSASSSAWWNSLVDHVTAAATLSAAAGMPYRLGAVEWCQGEDDARVGTAQATYSAALVQLAADIDTRLRAAINAVMTANSLPTQDTPIHLLIMQTGTNYSAAQSGTLANLANVRQAQVDAVNLSPLIHFVRPMFDLPPAPKQVHITNVGNRLMGRYLGRAYKHLTIDQRVPDCVWPISATARGATLTIKFRVPTFPLVFDPAALGMVTDNGIRVEDASGTLTLTNIKVDAGGDSISMTVNRALVANAMVHLGMHYTAVGNGFAMAATHCLRDSTPDTTTIQGVTKPMWHIAPSFRMPVRALATNP